MNPLSILLVSFCVLASLQQGRSEDELVVFSSSGTFRPGWTAGGWGRLAVSPTKGGENGGAAVEGVINAETQPWCGLSLQSASGAGRASNSIPLTDELKQNGVIVLRLNLGKMTESGEVVGDGQKIQFALVFLLQDGSSSPPANITLAKLGYPPALDGDPDTWEEIRIPLRDVLDTLPDASQVKAITMINVQMGGTPIYGIKVGDCRILKE